MELKKIAWFLRIVDEGSLSRAAQSLYVSQPALSRFLEKLEEEVRTPLFFRERNNALRLTAAGEAYLETARKIQQQWQALDAHMERWRDPGKKLVFGIHGDYLRPFAAECVQKLKQRYPDLEVSCFCDSSPEIQRLAAEGKICMGTCAYDTEDPRLRYAQCSKARMDLVVDREHPLAKLSCQLPGQEDLHVSLRQLGADPGFAMMRGNTVLRRVAESWLREQHYEPRVEQTYLRHGLIPEVLRGSRLIGFCPENNISPQLSYLAPEPEMYYVQGVCWPHKATFTPAERYLLSLLKKMPTQRML